MNAYTESQISAFHALRGATVVAWSGVEMAFRDEGPDGVPQFTDPPVPCLQLLQLRVDLGGARLIHIGTYQNNDVWGLRLEGAASPLLSEDDVFDGIYRERLLNELPVGTISHVTVTQSEPNGELGEVGLVVGERDLILVAGEIYDRADGHLFVVLGDESVLVFTDPRDVDQVRHTAADGHT